MIPPSTHARSTQPEECSSPIIGATFLYTPEPIILAITKTTTSLRPSVRLSCLGELRPGSEELISRISMKKRNCFYPANLILFFHRRLDHTYQEPVYQVISNKPITGHDDETNG